MAEKPARAHTLGVLGVLADHLTTRIGLTYPEIEEMNPLASPLLEGVSVLIGQRLIFKLGENLKTSPRLTKRLALVPALVPFAAATNNLIRILAVAQSRPVPADFENTPRLGRIYDFARLRGWTRVMKLCQKICERRT